MTLQLVGRRWLRDKPLDDDWTQASPMTFEEKLLPDTTIEEHRITATLPLRVEIPLPLYGRLMAYIRAVNFEVSGLGCATLEDSVFRLTELHFVKQEGGGAHTQLDPVDIAKLLGRRIKQGKRSPINVWWHSHVTMGTFWSGTDMTTAQGLAKGKPFMLSLVGVQDGTLRCRVDIGHPVPVGFDAVPIVVSGYTGQTELVTKKQIAFAQQEITKKVKETTLYTTVTEPLVLPTHDPNLLVNDPHAHDFITYL